MTAMDAYSGQTYEHCPAQRGVWSASGMIWTPTTITFQINGRTCFVNNSSTTGFATMDVDYVRGSAPMRRHTGRYLAYALRGIQPRDSSFPTVRCTVLVTQQPIAVERGRPRTGVLDLDSSWVANCRAQ